MADPGVCGALADNTTPEWARGKVECMRPLAGKTHDGPHSARVSPPGGGPPVTLSWVEDARPRDERPGEEPEPAEPEVEGDAAPRVRERPPNEVDALLVELVERGLIPEGMDVAGVLHSRSVLEQMLDEGWEFVAP